MKAPLVEPFAFPDREELEVVVVVAHEGDSRVDRRSVDRKPFGDRMPGKQQQGAKLCERVPPAAMVLSLVDEVGVSADRDVVQEESLADASDVDPSLHASEGDQGADRIVTIETEVAREVVPGAERDADERQVALDRDLGDRRQRSVAPGDPHRPRVGSCELRRIVVGAEDSGLDPLAPCRLFKLLRARILTTRARIDE